VPDGATSEYAPSDNGRRINGPSRDGRSGGLEIAVFLERASRLARVTRFSLPGRQCWLFLRENNSLPVLRVDAVPRGGTTNRGYQHRFLRSLGIFRCRCLPALQLRFVGKSAARLVRFDLPVSRFAGFACRVKTRDFGNDLEQLRARFLCRFLCQTLIRP